MPTPAPRIGPTPLPPAIPTDAWIIENEGEICFQNFENATLLRGSFTPKGCFSSSCTQPAEKSLRVQVIQEQYALRFFTRFVLFNPYADIVRECTADCSGGGSLDFDMGEVERGLYSIWLGDKQIGELYLPFGQSFDEQLCFPSDQFMPAIPTPTVTMTATEPYPIPDLPTYTPHYPAPEGP